MLLFFIYLSIIVIRVHKVPIYFPVPLFILVNIVFIIFGGGFYIYFGDNVADFYNLELTESQLIKSMLYLLYLVCSFCLGVICFHSIFGIIKNQTEKKETNFIEIVNKYYFIFVFLSLCPIFLMILGGGFEEIFLRFEYISLKIPEFVNLGRNTAILGVIICGILVSTNRRLKLLPFFIFMLYLILFFSYASRIFGMLPVFYLVGQLLFCFIVEKRNRSIKYKFLLVFVALPFLLQVPLTLRNLMPQGLIPFISFINMNGIQDIIFSDEALTDFFANLFFSVPLTAYVIEHGKLQIDDLLLSLNPLLGSMIGWYDVYQKYRVSKYIPFNAPGELLNVNFFLAAIYYWLLGIYFSFLGSSIIKHIKKNQIIRSGLILTFAFSIIFIATQYNLRSVTRLIYYCIFLQIISRLLLDIKWRVY
jgi:hypothetical protein